MNTEVNISFLCFCASEEVCKMISFNKKVCKTCVVNLCNSVKHVFLTYIREPV